MSWVQADNTHIPPTTYYRPKHVDQPCCQVELLIFKARRIYIFQKSNRVQELANCYVFKGRNVVAIKKTAGLLKPFTHYRRSDFSLEWLCIGKFVNFMCTFKTSGAKNRNIHKNEIISSYLCILFNHIHFFLRCDARAYNNDGYNN